MERSSRAINKACILILTSIWLTIDHTNVFAQQLQTDSLYYKTSIKNTVSLYFQFEGNQSRLYNGIMYNDYSNIFIEGHPYFESKEFINGTIHYDGLVFEDVPILYDIIKDELVIQHFNQVFKIRLISEKVTAFTLLNHHFVRIVQDTVRNSVLKTGFYDQLYTGKLTVLKKQAKTIFEKIDIVKKEVKVTNRLYLIKDGNYYQVSNQNSLLTLLKDKRSEIQLFLKTNKIRFRKNPDKAIIKIAAYYDELTN